MKRLYVLHNTICCGVMRSNINLCFLFVFERVMCYYKNMEIKIIRQKRKTMVLKVFNSKYAEVRVPMKMPADKVQEFLLSKRDWLEKVEKKFLSNESFSEKFDFENYVYINGEKAYSVNQLVMDDKNLSPERKQKIVKKFYLSMFGDIEKLAVEMSRKTGLTYKQLKSCDSSRVWGSYSSTRVLKLNWKLVVLPSRLAYYVVCHELCHSIHMNHKPQFWKDVEKLCPDYKKLKKELKEYSFVLKTNF